MKILNLLRKNLGYYLLLGAIIIIALFVRINNIYIYNTYWADDGGAHIDYVNTILNEQRLPTMSETYLAWHEPLYYLALAGWAKIGQIFGFSSINWQEATQLGVFLGFICLVWLLSYIISEKNKWLSLLNVFIFSFLFTSVKLSAYITNEFLNHTIIILLSFLFIYFQLFEEKKEKRVIYWAIILGLATLIKLTSIIVFLAVLLAWGLYYIAAKRRYILKYIFLCLTIIILMNLPWHIYKHYQFGEIFSINAYEQKNKQNIFSSSAWTYLFAINTRLITNYPYWYSQPQSFISILVGDTFGDYYNLFNNVDRINALPESEKILTGNGRYSTAQLWNSLLWTNRLGSLIALIWIIGIIGYLAKSIKNKKLEWNEIFLFILILGACGGLIYNNLRLPYLERGVLKAQFILFAFPIIAALAYTWWWNILKNKYAWVALAFFPFIIYVIFAWPQIFIR